MTDDLKAPNEPEGIELEGISTVQIRRTVRPSEMQEFRRAATIILIHGLLIVFGILVLSTVSWIVDHAHISETAKEVTHVIDEYLMIFAFVVFGISFIIKIVVVILVGSSRR